MKTIFISYLDDDDKKISGYFEILKETDSKLIFKSGKNIITIPIHRLLKKKESEDNERRYKI